MRIGTSGGQMGVKPFSQAHIQVIQCVFAAAGIEGVAVGQEGRAAQLLDHVRHRLGVVGPQEGQVAQLAKMHFDGGKLIFKINVSDARPAHQLLQLLRQGRPAGMGSEITEINLCLCHVLCLLSIFSDWFSME